MVNAKQALARTKSNDHDRWAGGDALSARDRIVSKVVVPQGLQTFSCSPGNTFFAIGSCFARNVEERLELAGANVLSRQMDVADLGATGARTLGLFNKYTPFSILQELQFASGERDYPEEAFLSAGLDLFYDAQLRINSGNASLEALRARRKEINLAFARAFEADVLILTLGLIEAWFDTKSGLYLNEVPAPRLLMKEPDRFELRILSVDECREALREIHTLLARHAKVGQKIVITVSPVALARTFSEHDVIIANTTSKSTLRVAAMEFASEHEGVDYFPSYEAVLHSAPALAWQDDRLHASDFIVGRIISTFLTRYGLPPEGSLEEVEISAVDSEEALITRLRREVDRYKNQILALEKKLATQDPRKEVS
ncbi:GSCFA family protein [Phaeobacter sp. CECT 5382]|nr:GSCFA family protein [Phaeobacter sp. CECT 5382]